MKDMDFVLNNKCPYCGYVTTRAKLIGIDSDCLPKPGDINFCIKCTEASQFDKNLKLKKFDLNSIQDIIERNRLKGIQVEIRLFLEKITDDQN